MIFVNYGGGGYYFFKHARWNGEFPPNYFCTDKQCVETTLSLFLTPKICSFDAKFSYAVVYSRVIFTVFSHSKKKKKLLFEVILFDMESIT